MSELNTSADTGASTISPIIEKANLSHVRALRELWYENFSRYGYCETRFEALFFDLNTECLVATDGSHLVGFVLFESSGGHGELLGLAVARQCRRNRLGDMLVDTCLKKLKGQGVGRISFHTQPDNLGAQLLFESHGFRGQGADGYYPSGEQAVRYEWSAP